MNTILFLTKQIIIIAQNNNIYWFTNSEWKLLFSEIVQILCLTLLIIIYVKQHCKQ